MIDHVNPRKSGPRPYFRNHSVPDGALKSTIRSGLFRLARGMAFVAVFSLILTSVAPVGADFQDSNTSDINQSDPSQDKVDNSPHPPAGLPVTIIKKWVDENGVPTTPPENKSDLTITAQNQQELSVTCKYSGDAFGCDKILTIVNASYKIDVAEPSVPSGWEVDPTTVGVDKVPDCPNSDDELSASEGIDQSGCTYTVINKKKPHVSETDTNIHFIKVVCNDYSDVNGNASADQRDATGGKYSLFNNAPNFGNITKPVNPDEIPKNCKTQDGWNFNLSTSTSADYQTQTGDKKQVGPTVNGEFSIKGSALPQSFQDGLQGKNGKKFWVSEETQPGYDFATIRCYNDALNGDNLEFISLDGQSPKDIYCIAYNINKSVTINAKKIVCDDEKYLPNMSGGADITSDTAASFLAKDDNAKHCNLENWDFQWGFADKPNHEGVDMTKGDWLGAAAAGGASTGLCPAPWCGANTTSGSGYDQWKNFSTTSPAVITDLEGAPAIWIRENLKAGYAPFSAPKAGAPLDNDKVSAEIYCNGDVLNYDNFDFIANVQPGQTYNCVAFNAVKGVTIKAQKIVCDNESYLPNWGGVGGPDITSDTAASFLAKGDNAKHCNLENWDFQWGYGDKPGQEGVDMTLGDAIGAANGVSTAGICPAPWCGPNTSTGSGFNQWHNFDAPSGVQGLTTVVVPSLEGSDRIWVRENLKANYIPFSAPKSGKDLNADNVTAEMYCNNDVFNYDNYDYILNPVAGNTYYCIALNAPKPRVSGDNDTTLHFIKVTCDQYSDVAGNAQADVVDATNGKFTQFKNYSNGTYLPSPLVNGMVDPSEIPKSDSGCARTTGYKFDLAANDAFTGATKTVGPTAVGPNGAESTIKVSDLSSELQTAVNTNQLWVKEETQAGSTFAALRCYKDGVNGDNLEIISLNGEQPQDVYCIAYNVAIPVEQPPCPQNIPESFTSKVADLIDAVAHNTPKCSISGYKFSDTDNSGTITAGDAALANWTIYLDANNNGSWDNGELSTTTGQDGFYQFSNLPSGTYYVREQNQSGWNQIFPANNGSRTVNLVQNGYTNENFLNAVIPPCIATQATLNSGVSTLFKGLTTTVPAGSQSDDSAYSNVNTQAVLTFPDGFPTAWDNSINNANLSGSKWISNTVASPTSANGGTVDTYRLFGQTIDVPAGATNISANLYFTGDNSVRAYLNNVFLGSATDYNTVYNISSISLIPGANEFEFAVKNDGFQGDTNPTGVIYKVTISYCPPAGGGNGGGGNVGGGGSTGGPGGPGVSNLINGVKYNDANFNGTREGSEVGLAGWLIYLDINNNNVFDAGEPSSTTDANGNYSFSNINPGTYTIREVNQAGWNQHEPGGASGFEYSVTVGSTGTYTNNFGNSQGQVLGDVTTNPSGIDNTAQGGAGGSDNPQVLGASTELPRTGTPVVWMLILASLAAVAAVGAMKKPKTGK